MATDDIPLQRTTVLDLPPEIMGMVGKCSGKKELLRLRLVNKWVAACTKKSMLKTCYGLLRVRLAVKRSLENALRIIQHPAYGSSVRRVHLLESTLDRTSLGSLDFPKGSERKELDLEDEVAAKIHRQRRQRFLQAADEQEALTTTKRDQHYLDKIFKRLASNGGTFEVSIMDESGGHGWLVEPDADDVTLKEIEGDSRFHACVWKTHGSVQKVIRAVRRSGVHLNHLDCDAEGFAVPLNYFLGCLSPTTLGHPVAMFSRLTSLRLDIDDVCSGMDGTTQDAAVIASLDLLRRLAPQLERLSLSPALVPAHLERELDRSFRFDEIASDLCETIKLPKVRDLTLFNCDVPYDVLRDFLKEHGRQLTGFYLCITAFYEDEERSEQQMSDAFTSDLEEAAFPFKCGTFEIEMQDLGS